MKDQDKTKEELIRELQALREGSNNVKLALAMQAGDMAWWEMDLATGGVTFDKRKTEMLGFAPEKFSHYLDFTQLIHPEDHDRVMLAMQMHIDGELEKYEVEYRIKTASGGYIWFFDYGSVISRDLSGRPLVITGFVFNITSRKKAEDALRESEMLYRSILNASPDTIVFTDLEGKVKLTSPSALNMFGYKEMNGLYNRTIFDFMLSEYQEKAKTAVEKIKMGFLSGPSQYIAIRADGSRFNVEANGEIIRNHNGEPANMIFVVRDITERKEAEKKLTKSEERFRQVVEQSQEVVWEVDQQGLFTYVSCLSTEIMGYTPEEMTGKMYFYEILPDKDRNQIKENIIDIVRQRGPIRNYINNILRPDGEIRIILTNGIPIYDENGELSGYRGINSDITERKRAEEALYRLNTELEMRISERTLQLTEANHELESFAHSVSHDLRAPLRHITGFISLLKEMDTNRWSEEENLYLDYIRNGVVEMNQLIEALLSFSRLNKATMQKTMLNMAEIVDQAIRFFEPEMKNRNIRFIIGDLPDAEGDGKLIRQVWINLISNAIKYTAGKVNVVIEIGSMKKENKTEYFIQDNGVGFDNRYAGKLFNVFQRLHTSREFEGIGIGLANVKRIVTRHGGWCSAVGETEKGAKFCFTL